ncbi:MAG: tetratricopeptide repeat protein [Rhodobacteraceae bacterium]|nr:tetratricopeptide repeat protein [Paracoccaceae bacterium]MCY4140645.1 tetratricopeptide repeat protein [Paracoccaceae bacterium]
MVGKWAMATVFVCMAGTAAVASSGGSDSGPLSEIEKKMEAGAYEEALVDLAVHIRRNPESAAAFHWIGYANRKLGRLEKAEKAYARARQLDPDHETLHEYMGELFLTLRDIDRIERQLAALDRFRMCRFGREEFNELMAEIAARKTASHLIALERRDGSLP